MKNKFSKLKKFNNKKLKLRISMKKNKNKFKFKMIKILKNNSNK